MGSQSDRPQRFPETYDLTKYSICDFLKYHVYVLAGEIGARNTQCYEEPPFTRTAHMGSYIYAKNCKERGDVIEVMLSLETIGYFPTTVKQKQIEPWLFQLISPSNKDFIELISNRSSSQVLQVTRDLFENATDFPVKSIALSGVFPGVKSSDHWAFWQHGFNALMVADTAWARYPFYHTKEDSPEKLDYSKMSRLVQGLKHTAVGLARR